MNIIMMVKLKFEGEYKNGEKFGKEFDDNNRTIFEGKYLDDKRWKGKTIFF